MENLIAEEIKLIKKGISIGREQIKKIESIGRIAIADKTTEEERVARFFYIQNNERFFCDLIEFLSKKLDKGTLSEAKFYFFQLRGCVEIFARLLHLLTRCDKQQLKIVMANQLFELSSWYQFSFIGNKRNITLIDNKYRNRWNSIITKEKFNFPAIQKFSKNALRNMGCELNASDVLEKSKYLKKEYSNQSLFSNLKSTDLCSIYRFLCKPVHGEFYMIAGVMSPENDESHKAWIVTMVFIFLRLMLELVNGKILNNTQKQEIKQWVLASENVTKKFKDSWNFRKKFLKNN